MDFLPGEAKPGANLDTHDLEAFVNRELGEYSNSILILGGSVDVKPLGKIGPLNNLNGKEGEGEDALSDENY